MDEKRGLFQGNRHILSVTKEMLNELKLIGQIDSKFIASSLLVAEKKFLVLLDQHAVDERLRLEQLQKKYRRDAREKQSSKLAQPLKFKIHIDNGSVEGLPEGCLGLQRDLESSGIISKMKTNRGHVTCKIFEAPTDLLRKIIRRKTHDDYLKYVKVCVRKLVQSAVCRRSPCGDFFRHVMASEACARAVKFGDRLGGSTMVNMLERLATCDMPFQCAHGRPTLTVISYEPLERKNPENPPNVLKFVTVKQQNDNKI